MPPSIEATAPARVARRQFSPTITGMKRKLTMSFAAQMTTKFTSANCRNASATGIALNATTESRLTSTFERSEASGFSSAPYRSCDTADATVSRIAPPVRVNVTTAASSTSRPIHGGRTLMPSTGVARSGVGSCGIATRMESPNTSTPMPTHA